MVLMAVLAACSSAAPPVSPVVALPAGFWDHWGDGRAELSGYRFQIPRYGELRHGEAVAVFVTETFTEASRVKSDGGHDDEFSVLKLNLVQDFQTGIYDYNVLTSTFMPLDPRRPAGQPTKITLGVQEWCGAAHEQLVAGAGTVAWTSHSYFDGEADRERELALPTAGISADAMPILVRGLTGELLKPGAEATIPWLPRLLDGRLTHTEPTWTRATLRRSGEVAPIRVPEGTHDAWIWTAEVVGGATWTWQVEADPPHRLLRWRSSEGEEGELLGTIRDSYWEHHREGDEAMRAKLGLR